MVGNRYNLRPPHLNVIPGVLSIVIGQTEIGCIDEWFEMSYAHLKDYHGPSSLAHILRLREMVNESRGRGVGFVLGCRTEAQISNCVFLAGSYLVMQEGMGWREAGLRLRPLARLTRPYLTADARKKNAFKLSILQCLRALQEALKLGFIERGVGYAGVEWGEQPENGDFNWVIPGQVVAMAAPVEGIFEWKRMAAWCKDRGNNIGLVVRLNEPTCYPSHHLSIHSQSLHLDLQIKDGGLPTPSQVTTFLLACHECIDVRGRAVVVHCRAGLGRTGTMIGCWLIWRWGMRAIDAIAFLRIVRPGSLLEDQPLYLLSNEPFIKSIKSNSIP